MAVQHIAVNVDAAGSVYTRPMHPEVRQDHPGACPKCGMALESEMPTLEEGDSAELTDFRLRFIWTLPLTVVVTALAMSLSSVSVILHDPHPSFSGEPTMKSFSFDISGMTCGGCPGMATVLADPDRVRPEHIESAISKLGFVAKARPDGA
jgi:hypothetical protein